MATSEGNLSLNQAPEMRRSRAPMILLIVLIVVAVAGYFVWQHYKIRESTDDAQLQGHLHTVSAKVGGTVTSSHVIENQIVKAGDILVEIDPRDYQVALEKAKAELAEAQAALAGTSLDLPITSTSTESVTTGAQAGVAEARAKAVEFWLGWALDGERYRHRPGAPVNTQYVYDAKFRQNAYSALLPIYGDMFGQKDGQHLAAADSGPLDEAYVGGGS